MMLPPLAARPSMNTTRQRQRAARQRAASATMPHYDGQPRQPQYYCQRALTFGPCPMVIFSIRRLLPLKPLPFPTRKILLARDIIGVRSALHTGSRRDRPKCRQPPAVQARMPAMRIRRADDIAYKTAGVTAATHQLICQLICTAVYFGHASSRHGRLLDKAAKYFHLLRWRHDDYITGGYTSRPGQPASWSTKEKVE